MAILGENKLNFQPGRTDPAFFSCIFLPGVEAATEHCMVQCTEAFFVSEQEVVGLSQQA